MSVAIDQAISDSARDFRDLVWPLFADELGGGQLVPVESVTQSGFAATLDMLGMTDAWQVVSPFGLRGLATRIQWGATPWDTWTIRCKLPSGRPTEWHKLTQDGAWHRPSYVIQAYVKQKGSGPVLSAACIQTVDLRELLIDGFYEGPRRNPSDGNLFVYVYWLMAELRGYQVIRREGD